MVDAVDIELWIPITIVAAFMQNLRSALQKHIKGRLSNGGAAYVRFFYAWPFALLYLGAVYGFGGYSLPGMLPFALPFAGAFAGTLVFARIGSDNEITAAMASGSSGSSASRWG